MKILFLPIVCTHFHATSLDERPIGGTETAVIRLAEALHLLGQEVYVVTSQPSEATSTRPHYISVTTANKMEGVDALIVVRGFTGLFTSLHAKKKFFWTGDAWSNLHTVGLGDKRVIQRVDAFLAISQWHAATMCLSSSFPLDKTFVLRNGVHLKYFEGKETRIRKRLIYTSQPNRGLNYLPKIYMELKSLHPTAELHIFNGGILYSNEWPPRSGQGILEHEYRMSPFATFPDCHIHGCVKQSELARAMMKSALLVYPSDFEETSCISAMEAQAAGCVVVSSQLAALPETVGDAGILIEGSPQSKSYIRAFIDACDRLLSDDAFFESKSARSLERAAHFDWIDRAKEFVAYLKTVHKL
ncbi:MAG TPA: glycosyltransferase family 4 protein [Waddliaceae bacterium]